MAYSEKKDVLIHLCQPPYRTEIDGQGQMIQVGVYRYNGGQAKIGVQRFLSGASGMKPVKLGRMSLDEAQYVFGALSEALTELKKVELAMSNRGEAWKVYPGEG